MRVTGKTVMEVTHNKTLTSMPPNTAKCVGIYLRTQTTRSLKNNYLQMVKQLRPEVPIVLNVNILVVLTAVLIIYFGICSDIAKIS